MTITLPDLPEIERMSADDLRIELACALYARGRIGKIQATEIAGVDFFSFQRALEERGVPIYTEEMLTDDLKTLRTLFPK